jgi:Putative prokaryotic signal transducing protein
MIELLRSNDPVLISFADALLNEAGIEHAVVDQNMSVMEGSLGILPRRMLVARHRINDARRILSEAGLEAELS